MSKVIAVSALEDGYLRVKLSDGRMGDFDVKPFMHSDFFSALKDQNYFNRVGLFFSGVGWPGGQDLSPDTVAAQLLTPEVSS